MFIWREVGRIICYLKQTAVRPQFWRSPHCCPTRPSPVWFYRTGTRRTGVAHLEKQSTISLFLIFAIKKKFVLGSIHQNEQNISLSWAVCRAWETRVKLKTFQPLSKESWYPSLREMVQHVPKCIYLYILMKVINYCSISYCNCTYLLNNPILAHAFGLRLLATYEDVNMCMTETSRG